MGRDDLDCDSSDRAATASGDRVRAVGKTKWRPPIHEARRLVGSLESQHQCGHRLPFPLASCVAGLSVVEARAGGARDCLPTWSTRADVGRRNQLVGFPNHLCRSCRAGLGCGSHGGPHPGLWHRFSRWAAATGRLGRSFDRREDRAALLCVWPTPGTLDQQWKPAVADPWNAECLQSGARAGSVASGRDQNGIKQTVTFWRPACRLRACHRLAEP